MTDPLPQAVLTASCSCGRGEPFRDDSLSLSDVPRMRSWASMHDAEGHTVTITVVVRGDDPQAAVTPIAGNGPMPATAAWWFVRRLRRALFGT